MPKLTFKYGTMNAGKSLDLIKTAHSYREQGATVKIIKPKIDTRFSDKEVVSRVGMSEDATPIDNTVNAINEVVKPQPQWTKTYSNPIYILVDEAQFLTKQQVKYLSHLVDWFNIHVICYGLKTDFLGQFFEGSSELMRLADKIEEIPTLCTYCLKPASMNMRLIDGQPDTAGEQIVIGDSEYIAVCRKCFYKNIR